MKNSSVHIKSINLILQSKNNISWNISFKGTVPRDFRLQVFYMDQFPPSPWLYHKGRFEFFRKFAEIFAAQGAPQVSLTLVANGKNLQAEKFAFFLLDTFG
jgi:hypothetical protein